MGYCKSTDLMTAHTTIPRRTDSRQARGLRLPLRHHQRASCTSPLSLYHFGLSQPSRSVTPVAYLAPVREPRGRRPHHKHRCVEVVCPKCRRRMSSSPLTPRCVPSEIAGPACPRPGGQTRRATSAKADWRDVEPTIFGTLLTRALDPEERHRLGAEYTPRASSVTAAPAATAPTPWPTDAIGQITVLRSMAAMTPVSIEEAVQRLVGAKRDIVHRHLETLAMLGEVRDVGGGRYAVAAGAF